MYAQITQISPHAIAVKPVEGFTLIVDFSNGEKRRFMMKDRLDHPFYTPLKDERVFRSAQVSGLSIEWPGGQDICPDDLYENSIPI